jgi:hypothetical protein
MELRNTPSASGHGDFSSSSSSKHDLGSGPKDEFSNQKMVLNMGIS